MATNVTFVNETANVIGSVVIKKMLSDRFSRLAPSTATDRLKAAQAVDLDAIRSTVCYDEFTEQAAIALLTAMPNLKACIPEWFDELKAQRVEWAKGNSKTRAEF